MKSQTLKKIFSLPPKYILGRFCFVSVLRETFKANNTGPKGGSEPRSGVAFPAHTQASRHQLGNSTSPPAFIFEIPFNAYTLPFFLTSCVFRKDKDTLDDRVKSHILEREQEQIDRIVRESGGKLTRRLVNSQVTS